MSIFFLKFLFFLAFFAVEVTSFALDSTLESVSNIEVVGNKSIEANTIKLYSDLETNSDTTKDFTDATLSNAIKKIYKTGFFSDVKITRKAGGITIFVVETPVIKKIQFNGRKAIGKDKILEEISTKEKRFFSKNDLLNDTKRLTMIYQKMGYLNVKIKPMVEFLEDGTRVVVIFDIQEGKKGQIEKISIEGNEKFSDSQLKEILHIRPRSIFKLNLGASFDNESVQNEQEVLKRFYLTKGYPQFQNIHTLSTYYNNKNLFSIQYFIHEGDKFNFGKHKIENFVENLDITKFKESEILNNEGEIFNIEKIERTIGNLQQYLQKNGFIFAQVEHKDELTPEKTVDITYVLKNSRRIYLQQINIIGNNKTSDQVIRREILVKEGDVYDISKVQRSMQRIRNLQYFDDVQIEEKLIDGTQDRMVVTITVKERSTASINASIGGDAYNGISGNVSINESNFLGEGYNAGISVDKSMYGENYSLSFSEPYFQGRDILFGAQASYSKYGNPNFVPYQSNTYSGSLFMAYSITQYLRHNISYRYQSSIIEQLASLSSPYIIAQLGNYQTSAIGHTLSYDKRDNNFIPSGGYSLTFKQEIAGLGGNMKYISSEIRSDFYQKLFNFEELVFGIKGRFATIQGIGGSQINVQNLYSLGASFGMRGFNFRGIGPRYQYDSGQYESYSYGGQNLGLVSTEIRFPNGLPKDLGITTYLFADFGTLYGIDTRKIIGGTMHDDSSIRITNGVGVSWRSPMGPIGFAFGKIVKSKEYDTPLSFLVTFGGQMQ